MQRHISQVSSQDNLKFAGALQKNNLVAADSQRSNHQNLDHEGTSQLIFFSEPNQGLSHQRSAKFLPSIKNQLLSPEQQKRKPSNEEPRGSAYIHYEEN